MKKDWRHHVTLTYFYIYDVKQSTLVCAAPPPPRATMLRCLRWQKVVQV